MDARIGTLQRETGTVFYAFAHGYDRRETIGTLAEVECALGLCRPQLEAKRAAKPLKVWDVTMQFQHPAWDEVDGIVYRGIAARCKAEANKIAASLARSDGHAIGGRGRYSFRAVEAADNE